MTRIKLSSVVMDTSIQCRAQIDTDRVDDYAQAMADGATFPPVDLFGTAEKCWIGDGWHRVLAAQAINEKSIAANLHPGGRVDALRHALGANASHGLRRTNADKRRAVEVALREFPKLSSRAVAELCGVSHPFVANLQPQVETVTTCTDRDTARTGLDGKHYPATREKSAKPEPDDKDWVIPRSVKIGPPRNGLDLAQRAIMNLEEITPDDAERTEAFQLVRRWLDENEN